MRCVTLSASTPRVLRDFRRLPARVYGNDPHWVPPVPSEEARTLDTTRNPYFRHAGLELFVTYRGDEPVARAALVTDRRRIRQESLATFGYFEALPDADGARDLVDTLASRARAAGARSLEGPYSPNLYGDVGLQVDGFDRAPAFYQPHHAPWYAKLLERAGLAERTRLHTRRNPDVSATVQGRYATRKLLRRAGDLVARSFDPRQARRDLMRMREVYEDAFQDHWRFLPVSEDEYLFAARHLRVVTPPELVTIVERVDDGEPVAVLQCALDVNPALRRLGGRLGPWRWCRFLRDRRRIRDLVVVAVGIKRAWQRTRAFRLVFDAMCRMAREAGTLETTWITPGNEIIQRASERLGLQKDRSYVVYGLDVEAGHAYA